MHSLKFLLSLDYPSKILSETSEILSKTSPNSPPRHSTEAYSKHQLETSTNWTTGQFTQSQQYPLPTTNAPIDYHHHHQPYINPTAKFWS